MPPANLTKEQVIQLQVEKKKEQWERKKAKKEKDQKRKAQRDNKTNARKF